MYAVLPSSRMDLSAPLVGRANQVTQEAGHVGLMGRERRRKKYRVTYLSYLCCPALESRRAKTGSFEMN